MPMRWAAEDLNDGRKELQALKAVMQGPLLMAGAPCRGAWLVGMQGARLGMHLSLLRHQLATNTGPSGLPSAAHLLQASPTRAARGRWTQTQKTSRARPPCQTPPASSPLRRRPPPMAAAVAWSVWAPAAACAWAAAALQVLSSRRLSGWWRP